MLKYWQVIAALGLIVAAATGSFYASHSLLRGEASSQQNSLHDLNTRMGEANRLAAEEAGKAEFSGVVNGIRFFTPDSPGEDRRKGICRGLERVSEPPSFADGTPMAIAPKYLPPLPLKEVPPSEDPPQTVVCGGAIDKNRQTWDVADGSGRFIVIAKTAGEHAVGPIKASRDRFEATTVRGLPAVIIRPLSTDPIVGDWASVAVAEDFGVTIVGGLRIPVEELLKIAEGLGGDLP